MAARRRTYSLYCTFTVYAGSYPLILVKLPETPRPWRKIVSKLGAICRTYGAKNGLMAISALDGLCEDPEFYAETLRRDAKRRGFSFDHEAKSQEDNRQTFTRAEAAFNGEPHFPKFDLWTWDEKAETFKWYRRPIPEGKES